jgi:hypothetical protein
MLGLFFWLRSFLFLDDEAACGLRRSAERHAMRETPEKLPGPLHPVLGIYEAEYYDLVTTSFGSFVTGRTIRARHLSI